MRFMANTNPVSPRRLSAGFQKRSGLLRLLQGAIPEHAVTMEPAAHWAVSQCVDRDHYLEHRHLDARGGCRLVDDLALVVAVDGSARGGGGQSSGDAARAACRGDRRYRRSS